VQRMKLVVLFFLCFTPVGVLAEEAPATARTAYFDNFTLYLENDSFAGTDRDYTNGIKFSWSTPYGEKNQTSLPPWSLPFFARLPFVRQPGGLHAVSLSLGQDIYTPVDTTRADLIKEDRPYAGYSYFAAGFHTKRAQHKDSWELRLGVVGPASLAQNTQNLVHDVIGDVHAQGWDNQLNNEVALDLICERQWRQLSGKLGQSLGYDLIPHLGGRVGTVNIYLNTGAEIRLGWNLPNDFGSCPIRGGCETNSAFIQGFPSGANFHFFLSVDAKALARNIFLDGNTFSSSHSVDKKYLVGELMGGFAWQFKNFKTTYAYIHRTQEFDHQPNSQTFGSLSLSWNY